MMTFKNFLIESRYSFVYHDHLNPKVWNSNKTLKSPIRKQLLKIAAKYFEFLNVSPDYHIVDIIFTGSLANYNYTKYSDIDLHIIIDKSEDYCEECGLDLSNVFKTKKDLWSAQHEITTYGYPVEVYAQLEDETLHALGVYSVKNDSWVTIPKYIDDLDDSVNNYAVNMKANEIIRQIDNLTKDSDIEKIKKLKTKIKDMRKSGLQKSGEFSVENLAFKHLRNEGYLDKLGEIDTEAFDKSLSI